MNKDTLVLKDETVIELESGASLGSLKVLSADKAAMTATWDTFSEDNLSEVQVKNGEGLTVGNYKNLVLVSETSVVKEDGTILTTFCLREKTSLEVQVSDNVAQTEQNTANIDYIAMESGVEL